MAVSNTFSVSINNPTVPVWFSNLAHKQWSSPVTNWLGATGVKDPGAGLGTHAGIITEWTGMLADQDDKTIAMLGNGGHNSYYGNEVYSCNLRASAPAWSRIKNADTPTGSGDLAKWSNGQPASDHTGNIPIAANQRWFKLGMNSTNYLGFAHGNQWWEYDRTNNTYIDRGSTHQGLGGIWGLTCWDPQDQQLIVIRPDATSGSQYGVEWVNISDLSTAVTSTRWINIADGPAGGVDTTNHTLVLRFDRGNPTGLDVHTLSLASNTTKQANWTRITSTGTQPPKTYQMHWHAPSGAWLTWDGGQGIYKLTPTVSGGVYTAAVWSRVTTGFTGVTVAADATGSNKMYSKINMIQNMGDGTSAFVVVPRYGNPDVYVCRLTGAV